MTGVDILALEEVAIDWAYNWMAFWIMFAVSLIVSAILGIVQTVQSGDWEDFAAYIIVGFFIGTFAAVLLGDITETPIKYTNEYKVTISDEMSMNEFVAKYEIIDQEGKIYTVRERTQGNETD